MLEKLFVWLFSPEERKPISFITTFFLVIILATAISLFIVSIDNYMNGIVEYLWGN